MTRSAATAAQLAAALGWTALEFADARAMLLVPGPDVHRPTRLGPRWSPPVVSGLVKRRADLTTCLAMGSLGASRLGAAMTERLGVEVDSDTIVELSRLGFIPRTGTYKDHPTYAVWSAVQFRDWPALEQARVSGALHTSTGTARVLDVRLFAVAVLIRLGWLRPALMVRNPVGPGTMPMYRHGDVTALLAYPRIDWTAVRETPKGQRSPLSRLGKPDTAAIAELARVAQGQAHHRLGHRRWIRGDTTGALADWRAAGEHVDASAHLAEAAAGDTASIIRCAAFAALLPAGHPGKA